MNRKIVIKNEDAEKILKEWKPGKGNLKVDIKEDSIMYKREVIVNKQIWTKEQKEDLQKMFKEHGDEIKSELKAYTDKKFDEMTILIKETLRIAKETNQMLMVHIEDHK